MALRRLILVSTQIYQPHFLSSKPCPTYHDNSSMMLSSRNLFRSFLGVTLLLSFPARYATSCTPNSIKPSPHVPLHLWSFHKALVYPHRLTHIRIPTFPLQHSHKPIPRLIRRANRRHYVSALRGVVQRVRRRVQCMVSFEV
jgi:hypothetical protein